MCGWGIDVVVHPQFFQFSSSLLLQNHQSTNSRLPIFTVVSFHYFNFHPWDVQEKSHNHVFQNSSYTSTNKVKSLTSVISAAGNSKSKKTISKHHRVSFDHFPIHFWIFILRITMNLFIQIFIEEKLR